MDRIESQLLAWRDTIDMIDGRRLVDPYKEFPEFDLYNKAFRLKRFGLCPLCGGGMRTWRCIPEFRTDAGCTKCEFEFSVDDSALQVAEDVDDPIIEAVRSALAGQEVSV